MASNDVFPNNSFSASSSSSGNEASKGRLNGDGAWSPSTDCNPNDYLQIDLQDAFVICAVATQGKSTADHWTTKYKLRLSLNGNDWIAYQENNVDKVGLSSIKGSQLKSVENSHIHYNVKESPVGFW